MGWRLAGMSAAAVLLLQSSCIRPPPSPPAGGLPGDVHSIAFPTWLTADFAALFGGFDSFTARLEVEMAGNPAPDSIRPPAGELLGKDGNLLFIPQMKGRRGAPGAASGKMSFLWNSKSNAAFVLSEPMQAYAPALPNVASNVFTVLSTDGPNQFPIKVRSANDSSAVTLVFSKISFKPLPPDRFAIPDGFTRYASVEAMMAEMMARQSSMMPRRMGDMPGRMPGGPGGGPPPGGRPP